MDYWCYFLEKITGDSITYIQENHIITIPERLPIAIDDKIIIYTKQFVGYLNVVGNVNKNIIVDKSKKKVIHKVFDDDILNKYSIEVDIGILALHYTTKKQALKNIDKFIKLFDGFKKRHSYKQSDKPNMVAIGTDIGGCICEYLDENEKKYQKGTSEHNCQVYDPIIDEYEKKSWYIIPIIIIPCDNIKKSLRKFEEQSAKPTTPDEKHSYVMDRSFKLIDHATECRDCNINNNNEKISIDMIYQDIVKYYKITDKIEAETIVKIYQSTSYYIFDKMTLIKMCCKSSKYYGCYFIVGKLQKEI